MKAKVALITGAAHGIGRAAARQLLDDGWNVGAA
jgi:NAD(P)-dependent dehydrogenase (short-subunit alcohol dehydrogenase family)